jgi:hypothetical protein
MRLDPALAGRPASVLVVEAQPVMVAAGGGQYRQDLRIDLLVPAPAHQDGVRLQRVHPATQARRQDLFELGERAHRGRLDAIGAATGTGP